METHIAVETHEGLIASAALWFVLLSPLIGLIVGLIGGWLVS